MIPVIAIVGQPNVGKSTLFNCLTRSRKAIVADQPGVTRDRHYAHAQLAQQKFLLIDTGGLTGDETGVDSHMLSQVTQAIDESDLVLFVVDARLGLTAIESQLAQTLRMQSKPVLVVVNKTDGLDEQVALADFYTLGFEQLIPVAASHGRGMQNLESVIVDLNIQSGSEAQAADVPDGIKIAIVGRPNVGKSTLVNRMLGEERMIAYDQPGTTRDSIFVALERMGKHYTLIDTAGVRRRSKVDQGVEKVSVIKSLQAIDVADVSVLLIDGQENLTDQDMHLLSYILEAGCAIVIAVNKWDGLDDYEREQIKIKLDRKLSFINFAKMFFISAQHGSNVGNLFPAIEAAYQSATKSLPTAALNVILDKAVEAHQPPLVRGRRIKFRYAHQGGQCPPTVVIHGNQVDHTPDAYKRYLISNFRKAFDLIGTPIKLIFKTGENPFAGRKNKLTDRQIKKRQRAKRIFKDKK